MSGENALTWCLPLNRLVVEYSPLARRHRGGRNLQREKKMSPAVLGTQCHVGERY